jgi:transcriptional regulator with XRE-family HTH domain
MRLVRRDALDPDKEVDFFLDRMGARIRATRIREKLTQEQLALRSGVPAGELTMLERGQGNFTLVKLRKLAAALGVSAAKFMDDTVEELPQSKPPAPFDSNYLFHPMERKLVNAFRQLQGKERRIIMMLAVEMPTIRDRRFEETARRRPPNWRRAGSQPDPLSPKQTPANGKWLQEHAAEYHGKFVALRQGRLLDSDPQRPVLISRLTGQEGVLLVNLLDIAYPKFERYSFSSPPTPPPTPSRYAAGRRPPPKNAAGHRVPESAFDNVVGLAMPKSTEPPPPPRWGWTPAASADEEPPAEPSADEDDEPDE